MEFHIQIIVICAGVIAISLAVACISRLVAKKLHNNYKQLPSFDPAIIKSLPLSSSPPRPPFKLTPIREAGKLCPSLVKLIWTLNRQEDLYSNPRSFGVGFISYSDDNKTLIWAHSNFIPRGGLRRGFIFVLLQDEKLFNQIFIGTLLYVDLDHELCIISIKSHTPLPVAIRNAFIPSFIPNISLELFCPSQCYTVNKYVYKDVGGAKCGDYLHTDYSREWLSGVLLNSEMEVVGMKTTECKLHEDCEHILTMQTIEGCLLDKTRSLIASDCPLEDIKLPPPAYAIFYREDLVVEMEESFRWEAGKEMALL
ncbi:hypothetical protein ACHQM5_012088 [Ranunculus cassubicifolius]